MYLIFSEKEDRQTNEILDRLIFHGKQVKRYNRELTIDEVQEINVILRKQTKLTGGSSIKECRDIAIYHRRPASSIVEQLIDRRLTREDIVYPKFKVDSVYFSFLKSNYHAHQERFLDAALNDPSYTICKIDYRLNKYEVLVQAENVGMNIPPTIISGSKSEVVDFFNEHGGNIITKSLYEIIPFNGKALEEGFSISCYTQKVEDINALPESFYPTLFQKNIEKTYEIRVFYLDGRCYAAAILSQQNQSSQLDFRASGRSEPNRIVPYSLSQKLQNQIDDLMKAVDLNTGSLDIMAGDDGVKYFLEINPIGQYGWINSECNYGISIELAKKMIEFHG